MPSDLSEYVASRYLVADPKPSTKKRKRKHDKSSAPSGLIIQDDDDWATGSSSSNRRSKHRDGDNDEDTPVTVGTVREARKTTKTNWKTVGVPALTPTPTTNNTNNDESAAADAILADAAAETEAARRADDDNPTVVPTTNARMTDGSYAGLQTAAAVTAQLEQRAAEERAQFEAEKRAGLVHGSAASHETFYRDATGRRVDVSQKRAEARRAVAAAEDGERRRREALKGEVQVEEARLRRERLAEAKGMDFARTADDEEMNRELRGQMRWNDPMAKFLEAEDTTAAGRGRGANGAGAASSSSRVSRRPLYKGACPPNRYGIKPGYRWDGVDRGNGFETERFKALNRRERNKDLSYQWQMDE